MDKQEREKERESTISIRSKGQKYEWMEDLVAMMKNLTTTSHQPPKTTFHPDNFT